MDNVQFVKQVPVHPRERFKKAIAARLKNKKLPSPLHPRERLKQKVAALETNLKQKTAELEDELKIIKVVPSHPRDRLRRRIKKLEDQLFLLSKFQLILGIGYKKGLKNLKMRFKLVNKFLHKVGIDLNVQLIL